MAAETKNYTIDWTGCLLVESNPGKLSGTPILKGTRMPANAIMENYRDGLPPDEIAELFELTPEAVHALITYAHHQSPVSLP